MKKFIPAVIIVLIAVFAPAATIYVDAKQAAAYQSTSRL
jgi:hypothetical protein